METDIETVVETNVRSDIIGVVVQKMEAVIKLEKEFQVQNEFQVLNTDFRPMEGLLNYIRNLLQSRRKRLEPVERCLERIKDALGEAENLINRAKLQPERERAWCLPCRCRFCNPDLSSNIRVWKARFDALLQELEMAFSISSKTEQIVPPVQRRLQAVPDSGFVGSGIRSAQKQLHTWLTEPRSQAGVIGVHGIGGVGKTYLLKIIYKAYKKEVSGFFDVLIWVTVSGSFEIEQLQVSIAEALNLSLEGTSTNETRKMKLNAALERKRFLLILDNMSNDIGLNEVGVKIGVDNGSKLLISSRSREVIEKMQAKDYSLVIQPLSSEEGWELFRRGAFANRIVPQDIEPTARKIASVCKGLPLAINAVAAAMSYKKTSEETWKSALNDMESTDSSLQRSRTTIDAELYQLLVWSYNDLSGLPLKNCFLNCAAFLGDKEILVQTLVQMWDAEELLNGAGTPYPMDAGRDCIKVLVSRCLVECVEYIVDDDYHSVEYLKIHEVLRDVAIEIGSHQSEEKCLFLAGRQLKDFPSERDTRDCKRISVGHNAIKDLPTVLKCSKLENLVLASNTGLEKVPQDFFSDIKSLKILDLSCTSIRTLPNTVDQLRQLKFLNLAGCTKLVDLPERLCTLSSLQVLNLSSCYGLNRVPNLSQLTSLKTLILPLMESICAMRVEDLSKLSNLTELTTVVKSEKEVGIMNTWREMRNLTLEYEHDADADRDVVAPVHVILQNLGDMNKLQNFHLINYQGETLPSCIFEFQNMKMLLLHSCYQLKELPENRSESAGDSALEEIRAGNSFPILEKIVLKNLLSLKIIAGPSGVWDFKLQLLVIVNCPLLEKLPSGMKLPHLKELSITMCNALMELDTGTGGFPMLEMLTLDELNKLQSIAGPSGVWNEGTMSKLQIVQMGMEKLSNLRQITNGNGETLEPETTLEPLLKRNYQWEWRNYQWEWRNSRTFVEEITNGNGETLEPETN